MRSENSVENTLGEASRQRDLRELESGLLSSPRCIPSKFFYDRRGSELFEAITALPEYYLTRAEHALLAEHAGRIAERAQAHEFIELGSGAATKTRILLDAMRRAGLLERYWPFDVSGDFVERVAAELAEEYPGLRVAGIVGDFIHELEFPPSASSRLIALLGSTLGNFSPDQTQAFFSDLAAQMADDDFFLLGTDLVKDVGQLEAAYNDSAGVTAEFNRNILNVVNETAGADFLPSNFEHRAIYNSEEQRIEMWLVSKLRQEVQLGELQRTLVFEANEAILTEISAKYDRPTVEGYLSAGQFELVEWMTGEDQLFALALARKAGGGKGGKRF